MYIPKPLIVVVALVAFGGGGWLYAQPQWATGTLSAEDLHQIQLVVEGYHRGIDLGPEDASWVFSDDAVFEYTAGGVSGATVSGKEALEAFYGDLRKTNTSRHLVTNVVISPSPEGATGSLYMTTLDRTDDAPVTVTAFGLYEDVYVKTSEGWRIKHRVYTQQMPAAGQ